MKKLIIIKDVSWKLYICLSKEYIGLVIMVFSRWELLIFLDEILVYCF